MLSAILAAWGSEGDVGPFIDVGEELKGRGHHVVLVANAAFEARAKSAGLAFAVAGKESDYEKLTYAPGLWHWRRTEQAFLTHIFDYWSASIESYYEAIAKLDRPGKSVLVSNEWAAGARIAEDKLGMRHATLCLLPYLMPSRYDPPHPPRPMPAWLRKLGRPAKRLIWRYTHYSRRLRSRLFGLSSAESLLLPAVNRVRTRLALPPARGSYFRWAKSSHLIVCAWPEWFAPRQPDWPAQARQTSFPLVMNSTGPGQDESDRDQRSASAPLVFTTGSVANCQHDFYRAAVGACRRLGRAGVLVSPHADHIPADLPSGIKYLQYAPFTELFRQAAAVVHHGGVGTTAQALAAGVPQLVRPMSYDQFGTAELIERLGVGRLISDRQLRPARLVKLVLSLLDSERVGKQCEHWSARVNRRTGLVETVDLIEDLAVSKGTC